MCLRCDSSLFNMIYGVCFDSPWKIQKNILFWFWWWVLLKIFLVGLLNYFRYVVSHYVHENQDLVSFGSSLGWFELNWLCLIWIGLLLFLTSPSPSSFCTKNCKLYPLQFFAWKNYQPIQLQFLHIKL